MSNIGKNLLNALKLKYESEIECAKATLSIYMTNPVGIGEHPQHIQEMDTLIEKIANNKDKLEALNSINN